MAPSVKRTDQVTKEDLSGLVAAEVEQLLVRLDPDLKRPALVSAAKLAGAAAASFVGLSLKRQAALSSSLDVAADKLNEFIEELAGEARQDILALPAAEENGLAVNSVLPANLSAAVTLHDWVGPSAGPTFLEEHFGIPRSTLHRWQRRNEAIALLAGGRRHVFPLAQFVDGRPATGISHVTEIIGHPRLAWYWLSRPCESLAGYLPIDLLKMDRVEEVVQAATDYARSLSLRANQHLDP
ncbi:antitoxin Xre/MbcA/ParS-like domain-containing protein [Aminobacter sp. LjRoot7]|uniref:antitoxin Xre/MbcA/ParS-like domain-containing protein n=1 Tax=Aminobacter sp. LjRoot7 TaxID=3342335 RepID=UPI003ED1649B